MARSAARGDDRPQQRSKTMLGDLIDLLNDASTLVCVWRDGELYIEPAAQQSAK